MYGENIYMFLEAAVVGIGVIGITTANACIIASTRIDYYVDMFVQQAKL